MAECERLEKQREIVSESIHEYVSDGVAELLADVRAVMKEEGITQTDLASRCGWQQPLIAAYLSGKKEPGIGNLVKMAAALDRSWRLTRNDAWPMVVR